MCIDFNPRLREGGDIICIVGNSCIVNFNPRLREGGDLTFYSSYMGMIISIHASAKEATEIRARGPHSKKDFNPRLREGGDVLNLASAGAMSLISIHASAKEATKDHHFWKWLKMDFNPRLREGGDKKEGDGSVYSLDFNPRLREGGDVDALKTEEKCIISIHASAKEATWN